MTADLWALFAAIVLGIVHVSADSFSFKAQVGNAYTVGPRDRAIERVGIAGRLHRAARNYTENFVLFVAMLFVLREAGQLERLGTIAAYAWVAGRGLYLAAYASGVPWVRTICWQIAMVGLTAMAVDLFV